MSGNKTPEYEFWMSCGLKSAALFYLDQNATRTERAARILQESYAALPPFIVERGLPDSFAGSPWIEGDRGGEYGFWVDGSGLFHFDREKYRKLLERYQEDPVKSGILERAAMDAEVPCELYPGRYWHCGTHKTADIPFLLGYGYAGYLDRIGNNLKGAAGSKKSFLRGMKITAKALISYFARCSAAYRMEYEKGGDPEYARLSEILSRVPAGPCKSFREAVVVIRILNLVCDSEFGRIDQYLYPYYRHDRERGALSREEAKKLLADLCYPVNRKGLCWHMVIGGCDRKGEAAYNELTEIILENAPLYAHPHITLRVRKDMPAVIWEKSLQAIGTGCGSPALVQEELFIRDLTGTYGVPAEDARDFAFGGCSEILIPGKTNVDSTWCAYNTMEILQEVVYRNLSAASSYEELVQIFREQTAATVEEMTEHVNVRQHLKGVFWPDPVMSLHTEGCLDKGKGYWEGGAVYNFDGADIFGNTNVINSLETLKALFDGRLDVDREHFLRALAEDFKHDPDILCQIRKLPKFGNGDKEIREIARSTTAWLFSCIRGKRTWRGNGYFIPDIIQWTTYASLGKKMGATPDGRRSGMPLADSCGAMAGTDQNGPTALLADCAALPHEQGCGTMILNIRLAKECFEDGMRDKLKDLFNGYFEMGGSQIQVNVLDEETLRDAWENPDAHRDIIVRIGGFTDYFYKQPREIQRAVLERVNHGI